MRYQMTMPRAASSAAAASQSATASPAAAAAGPSSSQQPDDVAAIVDQLVEVPAMPGSSAGLGPIPGPSTASQVFIKSLKGVGWYNKIS